MQHQPKTDTRALGDSEPRSLVGTMRSALGVALVLGLSFGLLDGLAALISERAGLALGVLPVGVLLMTEVLAVELLLAAMIFHGALRRSSLEASRRLFAFLGAALVTLGLSILSGAAPWLVALLCLAAALVVAWIVGRLGPRLTAGLRVMAIVVSVAGVFVLRGQALATLGQPLSGTTTSLLVVALPGLELEDFEGSAAGRELAAEGVLLEQLTASGAGEFDLGELLYPGGEEALGALLPADGARASRPQALWSELDLSPDSVSASTRAHARLLVRRVAHTLRRRAGDEGLVQEGADWLGLRGGRPSAMTVGLLGGSDPVARAESLEEVRETLADSPVGARTLLLLVGLPLGASADSSRPALFLNTRLVPHGGVLEGPRSAEALLPAAAVLLGWEVESAEGLALAAAVAEAVAGQQGSRP